MIQNQNTLLLQVNNQLVLSTVVNGSLNQKSNYQLSTLVTLLVSERKLVLTVKILGVFSVFTNLKRLNNLFFVNQKRVGKN